MTNATYTRRALVAVLLVATSVLAVGVAPAVSAQPTDIAASPSGPASVDSQNCTPGEGEPKMQVVDLHTREDTIDKNTPGQISGEFVTEGTNKCGVKVQITLDVPNNMYIQSTSDVMGSGSGLITATFVVGPGEARSIRAEVYATETGKRTVTADITYWPVGHKDMAKQIDGTMLTFTVEEPNDPSTPTPTPTPTPVTHLPGECSGPLAFLCGIPLVNSLFGLLSITVVGLLVLVGIAVSRDHNHFIKTIFKER